MNATMQTAIDAELELLERVVAAPVAPFGYGSDLSCADDLAGTMEEVPGTSTLVLAQALVRRLDCPRGALPDDPNYGKDIAAMLNRGLTTRELRDSAGQIRAELEKDDRVDRVAVVLTPESDGSGFSVQIAVTPIDHRVGSFSLTLAVTSAGVVLEEIRG